jgi:glycosyltransferase involved in cell wall biosynthesis
MNIWLVHPFAGGPGLGRHWRPFWLARAWSELGHSALIVSAAFHHLHREQRVPGPQHIDGVDFWFLGTPSYSRNNFGRLRNNLAFGPSLRLNAEAIASRFGRPDLIIASSPHLFFINSAHRISERFGAKFWLEIRDLWPESIVSLGMMPRQHPLVTWLALKERFGYRRADRVVCLLAGAEAYMRSRGLAPGKFLWIPNGVSAEDLQNAHELETGKDDHFLVEQVRRRKVEGKRVVLYAGGLGPPNAMEVVVEAARILATSDPRVHFFLVGSGASRDELEGRANGLTNLEFHEEVERSVVHGMLRASDCAVVSFHKSSLYHYGISPNKLFDYCLFAPRSVIACDKEALVGLERLVTLRCEPDSPACLADALVSALASHGRNLSDRAAAVLPFSYSNLANLYLDARSELKAAR